MARRARIHGMRPPRAQLVIAREFPRIRGIDGRAYGYTVVVTWEPARRRTILRRGLPVPIDAPALVFAHFYSADVYVQHYAVRVVATESGPEEALDSPAYSLQLPHCSVSSIVCLGDGLGAVVEGREAPDDVFWCTDFVDGVLSEQADAVLLKHLVGDELSTPRKLFHLYAPRREVL